MMIEERWVNVAEVAKHIGVRKESIYRWIDKKGFPAHRAGRLLRFKLSEVRPQRIVKTTGPEMIHPPMKGKAAHELWISPLVELR